MLRHRSSEVKRVRWHPYCTVIAWSLQPSVCGCAVSATRAVLEGEVMPNPKPVDVVGVFADRMQAEKTFEELVRAGFQRDQIEFIVREGQGTGHKMNMGPPRLRARAGGAFGALVCGAIGCLVGTLAFT